MSNVLPHTMNSFDPTCSSCGGDIIFLELCATVLMKWLKTNQERQQFHTFAISRLGDSPICPVRALRYMTALLPAEPNDPLFMIYSKDHLAPLADFIARKHVKDISKVLDWDSQRFLSKNFYLRIFVNPGPGDSAALYLSYV